MNPVIELSLSSILIFCNYLCNFGYLFIEPLATHKMAMMYSVCLSLMPFGTILYLLYLQKSTIKGRTSAVMFNVLVITAFFELKIAHLFEFLWKGNDDEEDFEFTVIIMKKILFIMETLFIPLEVLPLTIIQLIDKNEAASYSSYQKICFFLSIISIIKLLRNLIKKLIHFANPHNEENEYEFLVEMSAVPSQKISD